uniref:Structure-specific endonuclease subunit SLX4 n=1 Tax=Trichobilharzia regenti TaxID=157069 RepID=A0AA85KGU2_TRIRE|nr:unnamed protein product [Trichobilharzia regenti]
MLSSSNPDEENCRICNISMKNWNVERRKLHKNSCCETAMIYCHRCPACHKEIESRVSRTHLKRCASRLKMDLFSFMALSCQDQHFIRPESEDIHTAYALSLSMEEEVKRRKSEAILGEKILPTDLGPPEHLLLSREKRENIFAQKLESILLEVKQIDKQSIKRNSSKHSHRRMRSNLWRLASTELNLNDDIRQLYYVNQLVPPLSPKIGNLGSEIISMSQIPGRVSIHATHKCESNTDDISNEYNNTSKCENVITWVKDVKKEDEQISSDGCNNKSPDEPKQCTNEYSVLSDNLLSENNKTNSRLFLSMVANELCSDMCLILDNGDILPAHKFIFAAWSLNVNYSQSDILQIHNVTKSELIDLLNILYSGDQSNLNVEYFSQASEGIKTILTNWGLIRLMDIKKTEDFCPPYSPSVSVEYKVEDDTTSIYNSHHHLSLGKSVPSPTSTSPRLSISPTVIQTTNNSYNTVKNPLHSPPANNQLNQEIPSTVIRNSSSPTNFISSTSINHEASEEEKFQSPVLLPTIVSTMKTPALSAQQENLHSSKDPAQFSRDLFFSSDDDGENSDSDIPDNGRCGEMNRVDDNDTNSIDVEEHHRYIQHEIPKSPEEEEEEEKVKDVDDNSNQNENIQSPTDMVIDLIQPETTGVNCYSPMHIINNSSIGNESLKRKQSPLNRSPPVTMTVATTTTTNDSSTSRHVFDSWLDDGTTPPPLMKRLRLSNDDRMISNTSTSTTTTTTPTTDITSTRSIDTTVVSSTTTSNVSMRNSLLTDSILSYFSTDLPIDNNECNSGSIGGENQTAASPKATSAMNQFFTPERRNLSAPIHHELMNTPPFTPLPKYEEMMTPELKRALSKYGVKPLPRKRAVLLLKEIYNQLHQYEETDANQSESTRNNEVGIVSNHKVDRDPPTLGGGSSCSSNNSSNNNNKRNTKSNNSKSTRHQNVSSSVRGDVISSVSNSISTNTNSHYYQQTTTSQSQSSTSPIMRAEITTSTATVRTTVTTTTTNSTTLSSSSTHLDHQHRHHSNNSNTEYCSYNDETIAVLQQMSILDNAEDEEKEEEEEGEIENGCNKKQQSHKDKNAIQQTVLNYLKNDANLYMNILTYTPLEFDIVHNMLKSAGIIIGQQKLMNLLDDQCITFTLRNRVKHHNTAGASAGNSRNKRSVNPNRKVSSNQRRHQTYHKT